MNCPKCGFEQEERLDCPKCGIVFSKYFALHGTIRQESPPPAVETPAAPPGSIPSAANISAASIGQMLQELERRLAEVGVERDERSRLRAELKSLEDRLSAEMERVADRLLIVEDRSVTDGGVPAAGSADGAQDVARQLAVFDERFTKDMERLAARLGALEQRQDEPRETPEILSPDDFIELEKELKDLYYHPLRDRLDSVEDRIEALRKDVAARPDSGLQQTIRAIENRLDEMERRVSAFAQEWDTRGFADLLPKLEKGLSGLEDLRTSLQQVSVRYSEIGELKKNYLVVLNSLESIRITLEAFKRQIAEGFPQTLSEVGKEVAALRAEYRQIWSMLHPTDPRSRTRS